MSKDVLDKLVPPSFKKSQSSYGWVIWLIVLILVIGLVAVFISQQMQGGVTATQQQQTQTPSQQTTPQESTPSTTLPSGQQAETVSASNAPQMSTDCTVTTGIIPGTSHFDQETSTATFTIKNSGKETIEGNYFEFMGDNGATVFKQNPDSLQPGMNMTYVVPLLDITAQLNSGLKSFIVLPVQNGNACKNQAIIIINR